MLSRYALIHFFPRIWALQDTSHWLWGSLRSPEILGNIARLQSIMLRGLEALWSPWIGISAPYPCATALTLALVLVLALALALAPARLAPALDTRSLHRLTTLRTSTTWKKQKIRDRDAEKKVSSLPGWRRTNTGRTQAKTGGESNISLARTSICIK